LLGGLFYFIRAAAKARGIKPILGCELYGLQEKTQSRESGRAMTYNPLDLCVADNKKSFAPMVLHATKPRKDPRCMASELGRQARVSIKQLSAEP